MSCRAQVVVPPPPPCRGIAPINMNRHNVIFWIKTRHTSEAKLCQSALVPQRLSQLSSTCISNAVVCRCKQSVMQGGCTRKQGERRTACVPWMLNALNFRQHLCPSPWCRQRLARWCRNAYTSLVDVVQDTTVGTQCTQPRLWSHCTSSGNVCVCPNVQGSPEVGIRWGSWAGSSGSGRTYKKDQYALSQSLCHVPAQTWQCWRPLPLRCHRL